MLNNQLVVHKTAPRHSYPAQPSMASRLRNTALPLGPRNCHHSLKVLSSAHFYFPWFSTLWSALFITRFQLRKDIDGSQIYISSLLIMSPVASPRLILLKLETVKGGEKRTSVSLPSPFKWPPFPSTSIVSHGTLSWLWFPGSDSKPHLQSPPVAASSRSALFPFLLISISMAAAQCRTLAGFPGSPPRLHPPHSCWNCLH